jgi:hypothetical protein
VLFRPTKMMKNEAKLRLSRIRVEADRRGGKSRSVLKIRAARLNGLLGGASWLATLKPWEPTEEVRRPNGRTFITTAS